MRVEMIDEFALGNPFTREGSQVQSLSRPPSLTLKYLTNFLCGMPATRHRSENVSGTRHNDPWKIRGVGTLAATRRSAAVPPAPLSGCGVG